MKQLEGYIPYERDYKILSRKLRSRSTTAEKRLWNAIRRRSVEGCLFVRQKPLLSYIADFYCSELLLVVEIDGASHDHKRELDINRTLELEEYRITVIRYSNEQIMNDLPRVIIHLSKVVQALKNKYSTS